MSSFIIIDSASLAEPGTGPITPPGNYLKSGTTDFILQSKDDKMEKSGTSDFILLSSGTCQDFMLKSGGTDKILISGGTDRLLIGGNCTSFLIMSERRIIKSVG